MGCYGGHGGATHIFEGVKQEQPGLACLKNGGEISISRISAKICRNLARIT